MRKLALVCALALTALIGGAPGALAVTQTTALTQLRWLVDATSRLPIPEAEQRQHLSDSFETAVGGPAGVNSVLASVGKQTLGQVQVDETTHASATTTSSVADFVLDVYVDGTGLVLGANFRPDGPTPGSWSEVDSQLRSIGSRASFASSVIGADGRCQVQHGVNANTQRPLGSAFKLYVLGALGQSVAEHKASWDEQLAIRDDWKSLPSGVLQDQPAGTKLTLEQYADYMISISDNTATDHLIHRLGRDTVQEQLYRFGNQRPSVNIPFMTTRNLFSLKGYQYPTGADRYLSLPRWKRPAALAALDQIPRTDIRGWTQPEKIDQLEWFGSPTDICRAYSGLLKENQPQLGKALSINDGSIGLDRTRYPTVWFKGGSEPGVLTLNYLARQADGRTIVSSVMVSDPGKPLDDFPVTVKMINIARAGVLLASH